MSEMMVLLADKYGVERKSSGDTLDEIDPKNLNCMKYKLDKLQADRDFILRVLTKTYQNLCIERDFQYLADTVNGILQKYERQYKLAEEDQKNKTLRREATRQLRQLRNHVKSVTYDSNSEIETLRAKLEDVELKTWTRERYAEGWQRSRTEQNLQILYDKEKVPTQAILELKRRVELEQRVHAEIELLTTININETLGKVESWMAKYETDMESIDLRLQVIANDYESLQNKNQRLEETIKEHAESIKSWVEFKNEREAARKHCEKMHNSAIIIQAWWRGLLVRNQLGPYKPVKKKGGASKTGEKSKKK
ncbi:dynein regulatory complex protein 9-like [Maniola hyperantus]|uniref:dynein regulatory complex protein 9-like n=1 Tax=Aphantopus hyperantus TaxID=2795564 RepID=UPI001568521B|nr:dynein regulatory complex protein 9-like [Maniola hyperantus]